MIETNYGSSDNRYGQANNSIYNAYNSVWIYKSKTDKIDFIYEQN